MRVFVLSTGRSGTLTISRAFAHADNYTTDHEGLFPHYVPAGYLSSDSRWVWLLGYLHETYPDARYIHLLRDRGAVALSFARRCSVPGEAPGAWRFGVHLLNDRVVAADPVAGAAHLWDIINANVRTFLEGRPHRVVWIEQLAEAMPELWAWLGATGDLDAAVAEAAVRHNSH